MHVNSLRKGLPFHPGTLGPKKQAGEDLPVNARLGRAGPSWRLTPGPGEPGASWPHRFLHLLTESLFFYTCAPHCFSNLLLKSDFADKKKLLNLIKTHRGWQVLNISRGSILPTTRASLALGAPWAGQGLRVQVFLWIVFGRLLFLIETGLTLHLVRTIFIQ